MRGEGLSRLELVSDSEAETIAIGRKLGERLGAGDLVLLLGPFGAGKTHLVKGVAAGLGAAPEDVNSPSFVVINEYAAGPERASMPIYHVDLYRIDSAHDLSTIGLEACLDDDGVCLIEWADRAEQWLPRDRLVVEIEVTQANERRLRLASYGERYEAIVTDMASAIGDTQTSSGVVSPGSER